MRYRQLAPPVCEASPWYKHGDHPQVKQVEFEGDEAPCPTCGQGKIYHGWIEHPAGGGHVVCPGNYVLFTDHFYPLPAAEFLRSYGPLVAEDAAENLAATVAEVSQALENARERRKSLKSPLEPLSVGLIWLQGSLLWLREAVSVVKK